MPNYQNGMIYKLVCNDLSIKDIYIGSTTSFRKRKYTHKGSCNDINAKNYNSKVYKFIRDNGGFKNWSMVLIAETPCNSKLELNKFERKFYEELNPKLNSVCPGRTKKEWYNDNKEHNKIKHKKYYEDNKDKIKKNYEDNKDKIKIKHKKYRQDNKDKIKIKQKKYYEDNKDKEKIRSKKYREDNKDKSKKYREDNKDKSKKYYEDNKDKEKIRSKKYRENNKDKLKKYRDDNKDKLKIKQKKYREDNKDKSKIEYKKWYEKNKEELNTKRKMKINCEFCNKLISKRNITTHHKTKKCILIKKNI